MHIESIMRKNYSASNNIDISLIKRFLKIEHDDEDNIIKTLVEAAIDICEKYTECAIIRCYF